MIEIANAVYDAFRKRERPLGAYLTHFPRDPDDTAYFSISVGGRNYIFEDNKTHLDPAHKIDVSRSKLAAYRRVRCLDAFKAAVHVPKTLSYHYGLHMKKVSSDGLDRKFSDLRGIVSDIEKEFGYPVFLKPDNGAMGRDCFYIEDANTLFDALLKINRGSEAMLAQQALQIKTEYRAVYFKGQVYCIFDRMFRERGVKHGNVLSLDEANMTPPVATVFLNDPQKVEAIKQATFAMAEDTGLLYFAMDVAEDIEGNLWFIEVQSSPMLHLMHSGQGKQDMDCLAHAILDHIECDY